LAGPFAVDPSARQHTDVVLIYEVLGKSRPRSNPLAIANLALIPMWVLPSRNVEADGHAQAVLLDVRNGDTYGFASAVAEDAAFTLSTLINSSDANMALKLRLELAEKRAAQAKVQQGPN
jgi:hypothetical protein